jgi:hypothetical protein
MAPSDPRRLESHHRPFGIISRSNSANAPNTWKMSLPPAVVVSRDFFRLLKPTPLPSSSPTRSISSLSDLPKRSSLATTRTSPSLQDTLKIRTAAVNNASTYSPGCGGDLAPRHIMILMKRTVWLAR